MAYSILANPNVAKTALDKVLFGTYNYEKHPEYATALSMSVFNQEKADSSAVISEINAPNGYWAQTAETVAYNVADPSTTQIKTVPMIKWTQTLEITEEMEADGKFNVVRRNVEAMGVNARKTRDLNAFDLYRGGFTTTLTHAGVTWFNDAHTTIAGGAADNNLTDALSDASLNDAIVQLVELPAQDDTAGGCVPNVLLVPIAEFKNAAILADTEYRPGTDFNDINVYSSKYGIKVGTSNFLGTVAGGSDTAWFLLSDHHTAYRYERQAVDTRYVPKQYQNNGVAYYQGMFREAYEAMDYTGAVGSNGTT